MESFWASSKNREQSQMFFFIRWLIETYTEEKTLYLGGSLPGHLIGCIRIC